MKHFDMRSMILLGLAGLVLLGLVTRGRADEDSRSVRAHAIYLTLRSQHQAHPEDGEVAWKFGRACFDWAEFAMSREQREKIAKEGIDASRKAVESNSNSAQAHYYLALNLGELARSRSLGALKLVHQMENELKTAAQLDPKLDYAGPDRSLGMLYFQAPSWTSIGSLKRAKEHLEKAVELSPDYPENHLNLLETYIKLKDKPGAEREKKAIEDLWPRAKKQLDGEAWTAAWVHWHEQWVRLQRKMLEADSAGQ